MALNNRTMLTSIWSYKTIFGKLMGPKENTNSTFTFCSFQKLKNNSSDFKSAINKIIHVQSKLCELKLEKF